MQCGLSLLIFTVFWTVSIVSGIDICSPSPCSNGAQCQALNSNTDFYCICPSNLPLTGTRCDQLNLGSTTTTTTAVTVCPTNYCENNGQCTFDYTLNRLRCACPGTFTGQYCETPIGQANACASSPCYNGGSCTPAGASFLCTCASPYIGPQCIGTTSVTSCSSSPCRNGGSCTNVGNTFQCQCLSGFQGVICETSTSSNCYTSPCLNGGTCLLNGNTYQCLCSSGYTGAKCENPPVSANTLCDLNPNLCKQGSTCVSNATSIRCICRPGTEGQLCDKVTSSSCSVSDPCLNDGGCYYDGTGYVCSCPTPYTGPKCETNMNGAGACAANPNFCKNGGT
jgi:hypothetical protein